LNWKFLKNPACTGRNEDLPSVAANNAATNNAANGGPVFHGSVIPQAAPTVNLPFLQLKQPTP
jgi:hypothetical protein